MTPDVIVISRRIFGDEHSEYPLNVLSPLLIVRKSRAVPKKSVVVQCCARSLKSERLPYRRHQVVWRMLRHRRCCFVSRSTCFRQACHLLIECALRRLIFVLVVKCRRISIRCSRVSVLPTLVHVEIPFTSTVIAVTVDLRYREENPPMSKCVCEVALLTVVGHACQF